MQTQETLCGGSMDFIWRGQHINNIIGYTLYIVFVSEKKCISQLNQNR